MTGKHARHRPWWSYVVPGVVGVLALIGALFLGPVAPAGAATAPSQDACHTTDNASPSGDCGAFKLVDRETFNGYTVPVGSFSNCAGDGDYRCAGLKSKYAHTYATLGAYPRGWYDTANPKNHSNGNSRTLGGEYRADLTTWISPASSAAGADGQLHVRMSRPSSGDLHVAALVPLQCQSLRYGKFSERWRVSGTLSGYKMAHLRYAGSEIDYPEAGGNFADDPISAFVHGFREASADGPGKWTDWHTSTYEITPSNIKFYLDGKLIKTVSGNNPDTTPWVLQNESALSGAYAAKGSSVQIDTSWLACYRYAP